MFLLCVVICSIMPLLMSDTISLLSGSAIIDNVFLLLWLIHVHFNDDVSVTVSQKVTTGSLTFSSISVYMCRKSYNMESMYSSPVPKMMFSPLSSILVLHAG